MSERSEGTEGATGGGGRLEAIWSKRATRGPMDARDSATLETAKGMVDDANHGRTRQITVIAREALDAVQRDLPGAEPSMRRANLMVSGVDLEKSRGKVLRVGPARIRLRGETRPCEQMDEALEGLRDALDPDWRGGAHGSVLEGGEIRIGDPVSLEAGQD